MRNIKEIEKRYKDPNRIPQKSSRLFKKRYLYLLITIIALLTNPSEKKHKEAVKQRVNSLILPPDPSGSDYIGSHPDVNTLVEGRVSSDNYLLFSITKVTLNNEKANVGFGIFGHVFLSSVIDKEIRKRLSQ